jgi:hypothetical protein
MLSHIDAIDYYAITIRTPLHFSLAIDINNIIFHFIHYIAIIISHTLLRFSDSYNDTLLADIRYSPLHYYAIITLHYYAITPLIFSLIID